MKITNLEVHNYRGIKECNIEFPSNERMICLIGAGDSTKSTILKAIEWVLWPSWNLFASDNDFFNGDISGKIVLRGTFTDLPKSLLSEDKFGFQLRRIGVPLDENVNDEPENTGTICLTIQLTIDESLEPLWEVVCNRTNPKPISHKDRRTMSFGCVGDNCAKDMVWGRFSVLQKYANAHGIIKEAQTASLREIANTADFHVLDEVSTTLVSVSKQYGVDLKADIKNKIIMQNGTYSTLVGLFEGSTPLSQRGLGSQRLLSMGLNIKAASGDSLLLIDEIENGLEPYRLRGLIDEFRTDRVKSGQIIMTTHSPVVIAECTISELLVIQSKDGITTSYVLRGQDAESNANMQSQVRSNPEAFLCKKIIVCEGKTEIGFIRALDTYFCRSGKGRLSYEGVGTANGGGATIFKCADTLRRCGYEICLLMDSDLPEQQHDKDSQRLIGVKVFDWEIGKAIEEQVLWDVPHELVTKLLQIVVVNWGIESVSARLRNAGVLHTVENDEIVLSNMVVSTQLAIGTVAKSEKASWFKRIDLGETLGDQIFENWKLINKESVLHKTISSLISWISNND